MKVNPNLVRDYARICKENSKLREEKESLQEANSALKKENKELKKENKQLQKETDRLALQNQSLREQHQQDKKTNQALEQKLAELEETVAKFISLFNRNSDTSSESTGTDQNTPRSEKKPRSANEYNGRKKGTRKKGAQPGHPGHALGKKDLEALLNLNNVIHEIIDEGDPDLDYDSEYALDFVLSIKITERRIHRDSDRNLKALRGSLFYGESFKALCVLLNCEFNLSYHKIGKCIEYLTHGAIHPSTGAIYSFCHDFIKKAKGKVQELTLELLQEPIVGTDATVMIVNGKRRYIRIYTTPERSVYQALETKSQKELEEKTFLPAYPGKLVHDHESVMFHFGTDNAKCLVHELRYVRRCQDETGNNWSYRMEEFMLKLLDDRKQAMAESKTEFTQEEIQDYTQLYQEILEDGFKENKKTKFDFAKKDERATLGRLKNYEHNVLLFLTDFQIPPDNNLCEARLRGCKTKQKVTSGFKTMEGLENYADTLTVVQNLKNNDEDILFQLEDYF